MPDLAKALEFPSLPLVWARARHFSFPRKILRVLCGYFEHQRRVQFEGCVAEPLPDHHGYPARVEVELLIAGALSEFTKIYLPLKLRVFCRRTNKEVAKMTKSVMKKLKEVVKKRP